MCHGFLNLDVNEHPNVSLGVWTDGSHAVLHMDLEVASQP